MRPRALVLGAGGMLGHKLWQRLQPAMETWATVRTRAGLPGELFDSPRVLEGVDAFAFESVDAALQRVRPTVVINCVGIVKQRAEATAPVPSITINALLPHRLHDACRKAGARLIHISTDCVFSGVKGGYRESDPPDAGDLYGRSKLLGEVADGTALTLRTSIIGRELRGASGLVEWFLSQRGGRADGYTRAVFSGVTTAVLAGLIRDVITRHERLSGLFHVAAAPIAKYDLLCALDRAFRAGVRIQASDAVAIDRSLDGRALAGAIGWTAPGWNEMTAELAGDHTPYDEWRQRVS